MPRSLNAVHLIGHLGRDAETRFTPAGVAVTSFSIAVSRKWKDQKSGEWKEETDWLNVILWRQENLAQHLTKGKPVYVGGRIQTRSYEDKQGQKRNIVEIVADNVILLGGDKGESKPRQKHKEPAFDPGPRDNAPIDDLDVPF